MNLLDDYSPLDLLKRPLTIFNHEVKRIRWKPDVRDLRNEDWRCVWVVFRLVVVIGILSALLWRSFGFVLGTVLIGLIVVGPWLFSVIVDLYTVSSAVTFWRTRAQGETLDLLRLTMPTDTDLLNSLRAATELVVWRGMRWETAVRAFLPICGVVLCAGFLLSLLFSLFRASTMRDIANFLVGLCVLAWFLRVFFLYVREPLWRMRALVAMSIAVASRTQETNMAILIVSGITLGLKVVQITVTVVLILSTITLFNAFNIRNQMLATGLWFVGGSVLVPWLVRTAYRLVHKWSTHMALRAMQGTEG